MMAILELETKKYIDVNDEWLKELGYSRDEVIGHTSPEFNLHVNPITRNIIWEEILVNPIRSLEVQIRTKNGRILNCVASGELIEIDGKKCALSNLINITQKKLMENEIRRLDRLNLIGEMAASIGHEIRNPLTTVRGFLQLLGSDNKYLQDHVYFELMMDELDRASGIISEYLSLAKNKAIDLKPGNINAIIKSLYPILESSANHREINVWLELDEIPVVDVDLNEIRQLVLNMSINAIEAMSEGGVLTLGTKVESNTVVLYIKDEGQGLSDEIQEKMGTPFLTTKDSGTGLGLAISFSIASRHNARIDYETGPDGTTFYIRFPIPVKEEC